jgi:transporter family-2 protein
VNWIVYLLAAAAGAANPVQAGANAELRKTLQQGFLAAIVVYASGLIGVLVLQFVFRQPGTPLEKVHNVPWWAWTGGLISIASTLAGMMLAQRLGSGVFTGVSVTASLAFSIVLDNFGWVGFEVHPASWPRMVGCALMVIGLWLVARF